MELIIQIIAALAIFIGALIFGNGYDDRPRLNGHNKSYRRKMKRLMALGVSLSLIGSGYLFMF